MNTGKKTTHADETAGKVMQTMVNAARKGRERFLRVGGEISRFGYDPKYAFDKESLPNLPMASYFRNKVPMTTEAIRTFGPYLYQQDPTRMAVPRTNADERMIGLADVIQRYLNYTPGECGLRSHSSRAIDQSIAYGRGVLWTGMHPTKKLICSTYDTVENLIIDPTATVPDDIGFVGRRRRQPRDLAIAEHPQFAERLKKVPKGGGRKDSGDQSADYDNDHICYWIIWSKRGIETWEGGAEYAKAMAADGGEVTPGPRKYLISDEGFFIGQEAWEVPYYLDDSFPCTWLDYHPLPDGVWPQSVLEPGLGYQKYLNWIINLTMGKYRYTCRTVMAMVRNGMDGLDDDASQRLLVGSDVDAITINNRTGDPIKVGDIIQQFSPDQSFVSQAIQLIEFIESKYREATGVSYLLATGEGATQSRSAVDAQVRDRNSKSRVAYMQEQVAQWQSDVARKEALAARFLLKRDDIAKVLGKEDGDTWGFLATPDQAQVGWWAQQFMQGGVPPDQAMQAAQEKVAQAVSLESWRSEIDYEIEAGSLVRKSPENNLASLKEINNQVVPTQLQSLDPAERAMAYETMAAYFDLMGLDPALVRAQREFAQRLRQQPPPMAAMPGQTSPIDPATAGI